jgi:5'(3')-deoxyribonucleotidase
MLRIGIDMDGTIADFIAQGINMARELFGVDIDYQEVVETKFSQTINIKLEQMGRPQMTSDEIYTTLYNKGIFAKAPAFEHAIDSIEQLYKDGHEIIIITKPLDWTKSTGDKMEWLDNYLGKRGIEYSVMMFSRMEDKKLVAADIIVEDDIRVLQGHPYAIAIGIKQPWNTSLRTDDDVLMVDDMREVVEFTREIEKEFGSRMSEVADETKAE